jgi:hypothetical protein
VFRFLPRSFRLEYPSQSSLRSIEGKDTAEHAVQFNRSTSPAGSKDAYQADILQEGTAQHARNLFAKIKEVESLASTWARDRKDKQNIDLVQELVTLREALCDDFAADLNLYIAFYCASRELREEQHDVRA